VKQVSKESVNYRSGTGKEHCGNCIMYHNHRCDLVEGDISPDDTCDRWEAKVSKSEDLEMLGVQLSKMAGQLNWMSIKMEELLPVDPKTANSYAAVIWSLRTQAYPMLVKLFDAGLEVNPHEFGWSVEQLVLDPMRKWLIEDYEVKSEQTPYLSSHHAPIGHEGLWHTPSKKVPHKEQLPAYIQNVRNALMRAGHGEQESHAMAVGAIKRWAEGKGAWGKKGKVTPVVQAAAQRALAEWNKLKEEHSG
jgi:hypothetical protein